MEEGLKEHRCEPEKLLTIKSEYSYKNCKWDTWYSFDGTNFNFDKKVTE